MTNLTYGVIDVGSNSVRLLVSKDGKTINKFARVTRLSLGMTVDKTLNEDSIKRTIDALSFFKNMALNEYKVDKLFVFATAGVRYAKNKSYFLEKVKSQLDLDVDVISGEIEAEIGALGALNGSDGGFIDVGGKSTEIVAISNGKTIYKNSIEIGVVTLTEKFNQNVVDISSYCKSILEKNISSFTSFGGYFTIVGGSATTLASIVLKIKEYDFRLIDGQILTIEQVFDTVANLSKIDVLERRKHYCIQEGREDVVLSGAVLIYELMKFLKLSKIVVRDCDNLEGYLIKKVEKND